MFIKIYINTEVLISTIKKKKKKQNHKVKKKYSN